MKLPVFKAFGASFAYVFVNFLTAARIVWLPLAGIMAVTFWSYGSMMDAQLALIELGPEPDPQDAMAALGKMFGSIVPIMLASLVFYPMLFAGVLRHVIRGEVPRAPFYLSFGADELRVLGTFFLLMLLFMGVYIVGAIAVAIAAGILAAVNAVAAAIVGTVLGLILVVVLVWMSLRLSLAIPAAVGARKIGIGPSWSLTKGNAWRLLGYWILIFLVIMVIELVFMAVAMPAYLESFGDIIAAAGDPDAALAAQREMLEALRDMFRFGTPAFFIAIGLGFAVALVFFPFYIASGGIAYRLLADGAGSDQD